MTDDPAPLDRLRAVIAALRTPGTGCPWDLQQTALTMAPHLLEETYETIEAIEAGDDERTCEELGDVLMNVFSIARIAEEAGAFTIDDVARAVADK
ncbi:MAG TPA: MazG nucleotide pyrophosphohydrolase domain-containing protein, partial [Planctomycetota bacterium]|nr:MazG nucleotide pyrophosphohydrolase domain-containing protein [Planctomycetota bacterium]